MSALLTTTMPYMKVVIDTMVEQGIREDYIVLVGGAPLNEEFEKLLEQTRTAETPLLQLKLQKNLLLESIISSQLKVKFQLSNPSEQYWKYYGLIG